MATHLSVLQRKRGMIKAFSGTFLAAIVVFTTPLLAAGAGFTVVPMLQEVILDDGKEFEIYEASVSNETNALATFEVSVIDFGSLDESGGIAFLGATGEFERKYALASWMQPETSELTLQPGEKRSVKVRIENRESLSPGGHYGALIFKNVGAPKEGAPSIAINQIFASLVFVKKTGGAKYGLELVSVEHAIRWFSFSPAVTPRFKNPGNVHVVPRGEVRIIDPIGRPVYRGVINEGSAIMLPETFREYPFKLFPLKKSLIPGFYTLRLDYRYDGKEAVETWSQRQIFVPPLVALPLCLIIAGLALFFWRRISRKPRGESV